MRREIAKTPVDPTLFPEAAHKFARRALREHQRAERDAVNAVQHAVKSGQALLKAYDLCEYGQWNGFFEMHFKKEKFSLRTGHKYMQLARNWSQLADQHPAGFSSQRQALKALAAIVRAEEPQANDGSCAARGATGGNQRARTGPVWRASGPFVREALKLVTSLDATLSHLIAHGYGLEDVAANVRAALDRLRQMLDTDIDQAEALQAAGDWTFVAEPAPPPDGAAPADASEREASRTESGATTSTPARGARLRAQGEREKEAGHDD